MPSDFCHRLDAALDVACPPPPIAEIRSRAVRKMQRVTLLRRTIVALVLTLTVSGLSLVAEHHAKVPSGGPQPIAATPAPTFT